ncbi:monovalent cation/H(+) antiporter subunit G [Brachybacterium sp. EF45031]|uniref:monovalent cation/H(+) antiporter subunit G n=1 Tax=Brachybacterium sillae TaxID=2810536 RepID=UPI00217DF5F9|nr:monovalent cation/H(+) antiporter subunit G [Brachybacterium sillae]MCS6712210.1 monovalent cation/H(+) antiporter subunit G [Brachybacterium sillae]
MSLTEIIASVLLSLGAVLTLVAAIGIERFPDPLLRMHAASKPQSLGIAVTLLGAALVIGSWSAAGILLLVLLAQMTTVPVASAMLGRAAFRRGFVRGGQYVIDELSPRLVQGQDQDDDEDGFVDELDTGENTLAQDHAERFPENFGVEQGLVSASLRPDLASLPNWTEPEAIDDDDALDVDLDDEVEQEASGSRAVD